MQKNELISITGTISHLHNLQVLMLHNNQLNDIKGSVKEISSIFTLKRLSKSLLIHIYVFSFYLFIFNLLVL